jgi:hypothetical protein
MDHIRDRYGNNALHYGKTIGNRRSEIRRQRSEVKGAKNAH